MDIDLVKQNTLGILKMYIPNLFIYLTEIEIKAFIDKAILSTKEDVTIMNGNFLISFFILVKEHKENKSSIIRNEFGYMNYLLGKFNEVNPNSRAFKNLVLAVVYDFKQNGFLNALGEISACLTMLDYGCEFSHYEKSLSNGKTIDFEFTKNNGGKILVDVVTVHFDSTKYENPNGLKTLLCKRISDKFNRKTCGLSDIEKKDIYIFPILSGFTIDIIKENKLFLNNIDEACEAKFNCFQGHIFGNLDSEYFDLFTTDEIIKLNNRSKRNN